LMVLKMENGGKCTAKWFLKWKMGFSGRRGWDEEIRLITILPPNLVHKSPRSTLYVDYNSTIAANTRNK